MGIGWLFFPKSYRFLEWRKNKLSPLDTIRYTATEFMQAFSFYEVHRVSFLRVIAVFAFSAAMVASPAYARHTHHAASGTHATHGNRVHGHKAAVTRSHRMHGQQGIASSRVTEIQQALIREHYLTAEANGEWDAT